MGLNNPFNYGDWFNTKGEGATDTGDDVEVGRENIPDDLDATIFLANTPENAVLMGIFAGETLHDSGAPNDPPDSPGVGVYGQGRNPRGIGVGGACDSGTGVYGIATSRGIGVAGRCMADVETEKVEALPSLAQDSGIGVLGHSNIGTGVRGHGGSLSPPAADPPPEPAASVRGGIFSAGWLSEQTVTVGSVSSPHRLGINSIPQLQVIPSTAQTLPSEAKLGDFYAVMNVRPLWAPQTEAAIGELWICTAVVGNQPFWQRVQLENNLVAGGTALPPPL